MGRRIQPTVNISSLVLILALALASAGKAMARETAANPINQQGWVQPLDHPQNIAAADFNTELLGHLGGRAQTIEVQGQYAFAGFGSELTILDISDPGHIHRVGWMIAQGEVKDIFIQGDLAYIGYQNEEISPHYWTYAEVGETGLQIVDIQDPAAPVSLATIPMAICGSTPYVAALGQYGYLGFTACNTFGGIVQNSGAQLYRFDLVDPAAPVQIGHYGNFMGSFLGLTAAGDYVYAVIHDTISPAVKVFDIAANVGITETGTTRVSADTQDLAVSGNYVFLAAGSPGLVVVDVANPAAPTAVLTHTLSSQAKEITIEGDTAYIGTDVPQSLAVDISDPLNPVEVAAYNATNPATDIAIQYKWIYVSAGWHGVASFETGTPDPSGLYRVPPPIHDMVSQGDLTYVATEDSFWVMDTSDPALAEPLGHLPTCWGSSIALVGSYTYLGCTSGEGLRIIDISDPSAPVESGVYTVPDNIKAVVWSGSYLYLARAVEGLLILDLSDPVSPALVGELDPYPTVTEITSLAVSGSHAYLGANNGTLSILDVSDPAHPQPAGIFDPPDWYDAPQEATSVQVIGQIAYLGVIIPPPTPLAGYYTGRVFIVDVSDPEEPVELGIVHTGGGIDWVPMKIELSDDRVYIAFEREGLVVFNNSTAEQPAAIGTYDPSESITGVSVSGEEIYLFNKSAFILKYADTLTFKTYLPMIASNP